LYGDQLVQAEQRFFTMTHCEAAAFIATEWHYPPSMVRALQSYLSPTDAKESQQLASLLSLASGLANMNGTDTDKQMAAFGASLQELGISPAVLARISRV
jgi:HD-like signal output (HDOD) protein